MPLSSLWKSCWFLSACESPGDKSKGNALTYLEAGILFPGSGAALDELCLEQTKKCYALKQFSRNWAIWHGIKQVLQRNWWRVHPSSVSSLPNKMFSCRGEWVAMRHGDQWDQYFWHIFSMVLAALQWRRFLKTFFNICAIEFKFEA